MSILQVRETERTNYRSNSLYKTDIWHVNGQITAIFVKSGFPDPST